ncbi:MAG: hypothetical protein WC635_13685 [Bacteriovorax sp.]|jgi:hypothetical protein
MDYDFQTETSTLRIPKAAYRPVKRCPFCKSVFIDEKSCEACGRSMLYHPVGEPFGPKSFYAIKERYVESMPFFNRVFPQFEDKTNLIAKSYVRKLSKRFADLVAAFNTQDMIANEQRSSFYVESVAIIDELIRYGTPVELLLALLNDNDHSLAGQELLLYLEQSDLSALAEKPWKVSFLNHRMWGAVGVENFLKIAIISATVVTMAVVYKDIISSQFGR